MGGTDTVRENDKAPPEPRRQARRWDERVPGL